MPPCHFIRYSIPYVLMFHEEPFPEVSFFVASYYTRTVLCTLFLWTYLNSYHISHLTLSVSLKNGNLLRYVSVSHTNTKAYKFILVLVLWGCGWEMMY